MVTEKNADKTEWSQPVSELEYNAFQAPVTAVDNALTPASIMNHERLCPEYVSKVAATDPDLIEVFDNFAFDEVISHDTMDEKTKVTIILALIIGSQALT